MTQKQSLYSWNFADNREKSALWYIIALSLAGWLIVFWFLTKLYGMSIVLMLIVWLYFLLENNADESVQVDITELGISIQWSFYDYSRIESFRFIYDEAEAIYLRLSIRKSWVKHMNIRVDNDIVTIIRPILSQFIQEDAKWDISTLEKIIHKLKL